MLSATGPADSVSRGFVRAIREGSVKSIRVRSAMVFGGIGALTATAWAVGGGVSFASGGKSAVCSVPSRYSTIQAAVDDAGCRTIRVAPGAYAESVTVRRSLTLQGAQAGQDARSRRGGRESVVSGGAAADFTISADGVTIDGFTLNGPQNQGTAALVMQGGNSGETIQNNVVDNPGRAASITTSRTVFRRNVVKNTATAGDGFQGNTMPVHDVTIADNSFSGADPTRYNADVTFIEGDRNLTVSGNRSTGDGTLIALFKTAGARVTGNTVAGSTSASAVYLGGANRDVTVSDNTISGAASAVKVANDFGDGTNAAVTITRNTLRKNQYGVNVAKSSTSDAVRATRNSITGNTLYGVFNDPAAGAATDATCNWWGDFRGPGPVGPGRGDKVSADVTYKPWLKRSSLVLGCR
jgi:parallel beta helix pectate lyase-like protein